MALSPEQFAFYLHVDDGVVVGDGSRRAGVNFLLDAAANKLTEAGFKVTDRQYDPELERIVGYSVCRSPARLELPLKRAVLLREALRWMISQARVDTGALRSLVGVWV